MADTDLIARVYPHNDKMDYLGKSFRTSSFYAAPVFSKTEPRAAYAHGERGSTEPPEYLDVPDHCYLPCIELRFSKIPRSHHGIIFGTGPDSDVVLPNCKGVGNHQFTLTFDDANRLIVKDWGSLIGTEVTYQDEGSGTRRGFQWIVGGAEFPLEKTIILITLYSMPQIKLRIIVNEYDSASSDYINKVRRFCQGLATAEDLFVDLNIPNRRETEWPTGAHTPGQGAIHLKRKIGEGSFATVTRCWNVSNGEEYALKEPSAKAVRERRVKVAAWKNEIHIMTQISHPNIVKLLKSESGEIPRLQLEYVPGGSLADQENISDTECVLILRQCLSALRYLHGPNVTIVHRDIKTENILVQSRNEDHIEVKLADFGLSKDYDDLSTICGTRRYLAPEVYSIEQFTRGGGKGRVSYGSAVDIWSLGTVVYGLLCPFPRWEEDFFLNGTAWAEKILETFKNDYEERPDELKEYLLEGMVVMRPSDRWSAEDCHTHAGLLPVPLSGRCEKPTFVSSSGESDLGTIRYRPDRMTMENEQNTAGPLTTSDSVSGSTDANKHVQACAPPPGSSVMASGKRQAPLSTSSASSSPHQRRNKRRDDRNSTTKSAMIDNRTHDSGPGGDESASGRSPDVIDPFPAQATQMENILEDQEALNAARLLQAMGQESPIE